MGRMPCVLALFLLATRVATAAMAIDSTLENSHVKVQAREALSVGTTTRLQLAAQTLAQNFEAVAGNGRDLITQTDLQRATLVGGEDVREAARYFLVSPVSRLLAGDSAKHKGFTREGFAAAARLDSRLAGP